MKKPLEGCQQKGLIGFFQGIYSGFISIIIKPTVGIYDFLISILEVKRKHIRGRDGRRTFPFERERGRGTTRSESPHVQWLCVTASRILCLIAGLVKYKFYP